MNSVIAEPESIDDLRAIVKASSTLLPVGKQSKPPLSGGTDAKLVSLAKFSGITQYEPSEFTFTAKAGTKLSEINATLAEKGQYLPFDPLLADRGATIAGTVAAGLSGPGRQRYGGIRDFLLGVQFISSDGAVINSGGKVVKNAAGFDIPKLLVGSLGRLGVMTELTFKVFPRPPQMLTLRVACESHQTAMQRIARAANSRWEFDAIDYLPGAAVFLRLGGPAEAIEVLADDIKNEWPGDVSRLDLSEAESVWRQVCELQPRDESTFVAKIPSSAEQFLSLQTLVESRDDMRTHLSVAGAVVWVWLDDEDAVTALNQQLAAANQCGLLVIGKRACDKWIGKRTPSEMETRIHAALDPAGKFAPW